MEEDRSALSSLFQVNRHLGKPWSRWEENIRINLKETDFSERNWVDSDEDGDRNCRNIIQLRVRFLQHDDSLSLLTSRSELP